MDDLIRARVTPAFKRELIVGASIGKYRDYSEFVRDACQEKIARAKEANPQLFSQLLGV